MYENNENKNSLQNLVPRKKNKKNRRIFLKFYRSRETYVNIEIIIITCFVYTPSKKFANIIVKNQEREQG